MKKVYALLCGIIIVLAAALASLITKNPSLFNSINEWAFFILLLIIAILTLAVTGNNPVARRKKEMLRGYLGHDGGWGDRPEAAGLPTQPASHGQDKPSADPQKAQKENIQAIKLLLLVALPPLLAVLIQYYLF
ncbi:MAG TPA: hypothetical protein GX699_03260 [Firmicutes bacterium]|nr:hypothetical protein [Bacillota bacterium]